MTGISQAIAAYTLWGLYALFFSLLSHVNAVEIVAHRAFWAVPFAGIIMVWMGRTGDLVRVVRSPRLIATLCLSTSMVTISWGFFVWGVVTERTFEVALGYYINPLLNVAVGYFFLRERMTRVQGFAVLLAAIGVAWQTWSLGVLPWLPLLLATAFCMYGLIRRSADIGPVQGFFVESVFLSIAGAAAVIWLAGHGGLSFGSDGSTTALLVACGPITALPLILFASAARRISFTLVGLLQYIAPTLHFLTALFILGEPLRMEQAITFAFVWTALALYTWSSLRQARQTP